MAEKRSRWLVGCGVGCGLLVLGVVALGVGTAMLTRSAVSGFEEAVETRAALEARHGAVSAYLPAPDGAVSAERMERFLAVREATTPAREKIDAGFGALPMTESEARELEEQSTGRKLRSIFGIVRSAFSLAPGMGELFEARNAALLAQDMGLGEYSYIYAVAYYGLLGHSPADGPETDRAADENEPAVSTTDLNVSRRRVANDLAAILRNQLDRLPADAPEAWRSTLEREVERLAIDSGGFPWTAEMPAPIADSLAPYRERLDASYSPASNPFELARNRKEGRFSFQAD